MFLSIYRTIVEENATVNNTGQRATRTKKTNAKIITSDYSSDDAEAAKNGKVDQANTVVTKSTTIITTTSKVVKSSTDQKAKEVAGEKVAKATKSTRSVVKESIQNDSNVLFEQNAKLKTSTPRAAKSNANANGNGLNLDEHIAFKEYKESGEYWK